MKLCHVIYIPRFSGAEILVRNLAIQHCSEGHEIAVIAIMPAESSFAIVQHDLTSIGVLLNFPTKGLNKWERLRFLAEALKQFSPDVIFAHAVIPSFYARYAVRLARLNNTPVVGVLHDASQDDYASSYFRFLEKWLAPPPAAIVAVSQTAVENYRQRIRSHVATQVIANGIQLEAFKQQFDRTQIRQEIFKVDAEQVVFLQVGRISATKQQHYSLEAFAAAVKTFNVSGKVCFAGLIEDKVYEAELKLKAVQLGMVDRVLFLGARPDIPKLLAAADVYLMPSLFEAHSVAFIEALASGIPIIASNIASFQFGEKFPGVWLLALDQVDQFVRTIVQASISPQRWRRDLSAYAIEKTASSYLEISKSLASVR